VIVRDLGSSNGTYVNGVRLQDQQRPLLDGQIVEFGSVLALLKLETPPTGDTATDVTAMHSYVRHLHDPPEAPKNPAATAMTLDAGTPGAATDHTQMLSQPACAEATTSSPTPGKGCELGKFSSRTARVIILAVVAIGLTVLFWLMLSRNR
jgi:pSer/pThr/pTyr-binding forkhead associated (FHA) protein